MEQFDRHQKAYATTRKNEKRRKNRVQFEYAATADRFDEDKYNGVDYHIHDFKFGK